MTVQLESSAFRVIIDEIGAELKSLLDTCTETEYIWNGDPAWWNGSAPVLFPVIGGLKDGGYRYQDKHYQLPSHGFARQSLFRTVSKTSSSAVFELQADETTRAMYPFQFRLRITFVIDYAGLSVGYEVSNEGSGPMYFSIGSHPAFVLSFAGGALEHYYLHFNANEDAERYFFAGGLLLDRSESPWNNRRQLFMTRTLFDRGPLIFKRFNSDEVTIRCSRSSRYISVLTQDAPCLGIWSKPGGAPFVCIEPWHGLPDPADADGDITRKPGIKMLPPSGVFETGYSIVVG